MDWCRRPPGAVRGAEGYGHPELVRAFRLLVLLREGERVPRRVVPHEVAEHVAAISAPARVRRPVVLRVGPPDELELLRFRAAGVVLVTVMVTLRRY